MQLQSAAPRLRFRWWVEARLKHARDIVISRVLIPGRYLLLRPYAKAMDVISRAGFTQGHKQIDRLLDLRLILAGARPHHIVELGSGMSTAIFARYAKRSNATLVTFEESEEWCGLVRNALASAGIDGHKPQLVKRMSANGDWSYAETIPTECDFLYIDGPSTNGQPGACIDGLRAWENGIFPRTIVIDGRYATVDRLLASRYGERYLWRFGWRYATQEKRDLSLPHRLGRHTVGTLRGWLR